MIPSPHIARFTTLSSGRVNQIEQQFLAMSSSTNHEEEIEIV